MSLLKSVFIVIAAGLLTVLLAIGARAGLEAGGVEFDDGILRLAFIPATSMVIIVWVFTWQIRRNAPVPVGRPGSAAMIRPMLIIIIVQFALSLAVFGPMGKEGEWPNSLSLGGLLAMAFITPHVLAVRRAAKP